MMNGDKKDTNFMKYWPLVVGIITIVLSWAGMKSHMSDKHQHIDEETEVKLTKEEYKNLIKFAEKVKNEFENIEGNKEEIEKIKLNNAVHETEYKFLLQEHEDLESKVSRTYKELKEDILKNE